MNGELTFQISRRLGIAFGVAVAVIEVFCNWGNPSWWPFILVGYIAVALLLYGALRSPLILAADRGFACAMFYMAFFVSLDAWRSRRSRRSFSSCPCSTRPAVLRSLSLRQESWAQSLRAPVSTPASCCSLFR